MYNVIFAMDKAGGIGVNGRLPWNIPKELELFKSITGDNPLVASRVTYEGLPKSVQNRVKAVQSSKHSYQKASFGNLNSATIHIAAPPTERKTPFVIGGASLFNLDIISNATLVYVSVIEGEHECDTFIDSDVRDFLANCPYKNIITTDKFTTRQYYAKLHKVTTQSTTERLAE